MSGSRTAHDLYHLHGHHPALKISCQALTMWTQGHAHLGLLWALKTWQQSHQQNLHCTPLHWGWDGTSWKLGNPIWLQKQCANMGAKQWPANSCISNSPGMTVKFKINWTGGKQLQRICNDYPPQNIIEWQNTRELHLCDKREMPHTIRKQLYMRTLYLHSDHMPTE